MSKESEANRKATNLALIGLIIVIAGILFMIYFKTDSVLDLILLGLGTLLIIVGSLWSDCSGYHPPHNM